MWSRWGSAFALVALLAVGSAFAAHRWPSEPQWTTSDSLFYQADLLRVQGVEKKEALSRVFNGRLASALREAESDLPVDRRKVSNPAWVAYSARFYERRWVVPVLAAAAEPKLGDKALAAVSLAGYALCGPLFFLLLRRRFGTAPSVIGALACLFLFPLRYWSGFPLTDSFGVALESAALLCGALVIEKGPRWLPLWMLALCMLGFTRDAGVIVLVGAMWLAIRGRTRTGGLLAVTGLLALLPAPFVFRAPLREHLAYVVNGYRIPSSASWSFVLDHYPHAIKEFLRRDVSYLVHHALTALIVVGGLALLAILARGRNSVDRFLRAAAVGAFAYLLLLPDYTGFRLELVVVPFVGLGIAAGAAKLGTVTERIVRARGEPSSADLPSS